MKFIGTILFVSLLASSAWTDELQPLSETAGSPAVVHGRAMWVWRTQAMRETPALWTELLAFCKEQAIDEIYLMINIDFVEDETGRTVAEFRTPERIREMLSAAHAAGVAVHAMHGDPKYALADQHDRVLAIAEAVARYNSQAFSTELFAGFRLGVEPYTLPAWREGGAARIALMKDWLEMNRKVSERLHDFTPRLSYGIDIPFWLDDLDENGVPRHALEINGVPRDMSKLLIDLADNVTVLTYRAEPTGPTGVMGLAEEALRYASAKGNIRMHIGVTIEPVEPGEVPAQTTFGGRPLWDTLAAWNEIDAAASVYSAYAGLAIHHYHAYRDAVELARPPDLVPETAPIEKPPLVESNLPSF